MSYREASKTIIITLIILLVSILLLIPSSIYSDIRGEFAKRPTAMPPEPAAVVNYLVEDIANARAVSAQLCTTGMSISVNLSQLGATPSFFQAIDQALKNAGLSAFTSKDFLGPQPDSISASTGTPNPTAYNNLYYDLTNLQIDPNRTSINFQRVYNNIVADCNSGVPFNQNQCQVTSACGFQLQSPGVNVKIGGCLATSQNPSLLTSVSTGISDTVILDVLTNYIPRMNGYFLNPAVSSNQDYFLIASTSQGSKLGCPSTALNSPSATAQCKGTASAIDSAIFPVDVLASADSTLQVKLSKPPRQDYVLSFIINKCPV